MTTGYTYVEVEQAVPIASQLDPPFSEKIGELEDRIYAGLNYESDFHLPPSSHLILVV